MNKDKVLITVGTVAVLGVAGVTGFYLFGRSDANQATRQTTNTTSQTSEAGDTTATTDNEAAGAYQDGTYKQSIEYRVPQGGTNTLTATVTVKDGNVSAVESSTEYEDRESVRYIDSFESGISGNVVGKSLDGLSVSRVGSSSLTASAFNDVLDAVRTEAKT